MGHAGRTVIAGVIVGVLAIVSALSYAALVFSGDLEPFLPRGIGFALIGTIVASVLVSRLSTFPIAMATTQDNPSVILGLMAASVSAGLGAAATGTTRFATVFCLIALTSLLTGLTLFVMGQLRMGRLIRFIPYPVVGGFLAGTGWLIVKGSFTVMSGFSLSLHNLQDLFAGGTVARWLPGVIIGASFLVILRSLRNYLVMPALIISAFLLFYLGLWLSGLTAAEAAEQGFFFTSMAGGSLWVQPALSVLVEADWSAVTGQLGNIFALILVAAISLLLNATGLELAIRHDADLDGELRAAGLSNVLLGLTGGMVGYHALGMSSLAARLGARNRWVPLIAALVCGTVLLFGGQMLSVLPRALFGGLLLYLGLSFLYEWLYESWFRLPLHEYFLVLIILCVIATRGFLEGIGVGVLVAAVLFAYNFSRIDFVKFELNRSEHQSNVERSGVNQVLLQEKGEQIHMLWLQGYLFFGTANALLEHLRNLLRRPGRPIRFVLLDFRLNRGIDSSAVVSFVKIMQMAEEQGVTLIFTSLPEENQLLLRRGGLAFGEHTPCRLFHDIDHGLEWCENQLLALENARPDDTPWPHEGEEQHIREVMGGVLEYASKLDVEAGHDIFVQGDVSDSIFFLQSGRATVWLELGPDERRRLQTVNPGNLVGELGFFLGEPRSATVTTDCAATIYQITTADRARMLQDNPAVAAAFNELIIRLVGKRLLHRTRELSVLFR